MKKERIKKKYKYIIKDKKGITLIALIITIILLIILAGASMNFVLGEEGILNRSKQVKEEYSEKSAKEKLELVLADAMIEKQTNINYNDNFLNNMLEQNKMQVNGNTVTVDNYDFMIDRDKLIIIKKLGETKVKITEEISAYTGKNESGKYEAKMLIAIESNVEIESAIIENSNGVILEKLDIQELPLKKEIIVELDETYNLIVKIDSENTTIKKIKESIEENINSLEELVIFRNKVNSGLTYEGKVIKLTTDINLSSVCGENINGENISWEPINNFKGTFDGQYHLIDNLYIDINTGTQGLFGEVHSATLKNIIINSGSIIAQSWIGGIVGRAIGGTNIVNCGNNANIKGKDNNSQCVGGITGSIEGSIDNCYNSGEITAMKAYTGGITGITLKNTSISNCYNTSNITGSGCVGGIVGGPTWIKTGVYTDLKVNNCYNIGNIEAGNRKDGIVGDKQSNTTIINCYQTITTASNLNGAVSNIIWLEDGKKLDENGNIVDNLDKEGNIIYINNGNPILKWQVQK